MGKATVDCFVGMRILTNRGVTVIEEMDRHGVHLKDSTGHAYFTAFTELDAREVSDSGVQVLHSSLLPWFVQLPAEVQATAQFRQQCILEVRTGYREGIAELAQPGEPFWPFGETWRQHHQALRAHEPIGVLRTDRRPDDHAARLRR